MLTEITRNNLNTIGNPRLRSYAEQYLQIADQFEAAVRGTGLAFEPTDRRAEAAARREALRARGATVRNNDYSVVINRISPACLACQTGVGSATFFNSLQCHRKCFYCFNPNQEEYQQFAHTKRDSVAELAELAGDGLKFSHLALTGGEPLLFPDDAVAFFRTAKEKFPAVHSRLYTSGDHINRELLARLQEAGLDEIRFSVRSIDTEQGRRHTYDRIAMAREFIPCVMVETPVLPGTMEIMKEMLRELERLQIFGINLLEFCYPFHNPEAYRERGYQVKNPPYRTLYDYWYAGGLPVAGSELDCLDLLAFMLDEGMTMGGHYCSLENKHTGQIYMQHWGHEAPRTTCMSEHDYFYKSIKVFGDDVSRVRKALDRAHEQRYSVNQDHRYIEFHPEGMAALQHMNVQAAVCTLVREERPDGPVLRELKLALTTPETFDLGSDL